MTVHPMLELVKKKWSEFLCAPVSKDEISDMQKHERTGRPLCAPGFLDYLETYLGRSLKPKKAGRKPMKDK